MTADDKRDHSPVQRAIVAGVLAAKYAKARIAAGASIREQTGLWLRLRSRTRPFRRHLFKQSRALTQSAFELVTSWFNRQRLGRGKR
jgi:hypothetical protein